MYRWVVFLHILGALILFMAHGASAVMAVRLRREQNLDRIRALMDMSAIALPVMWIGLLTLLVAGIVAGMMGNWWSKGWIGAALALLIILVVWMGLYAQRHYIPLRRALGIPYRGKPGVIPPDSAEEIARLIQATSPVFMLVVSFGLIAVILWLMIFKPF